MVDDEKASDSSLKDELEEMRNSFMDSQEHLLRLGAEIENQRKRMDRENKTAREFAVIDFALKLLPAKDSMEKAIDVTYIEEGVETESLLEGMVSIHKIFEEAFKSVGVEEIDPLGSEFNPEYHEAIVLRKDDKAKPNHVLSVFQKGYILNGRLIRAARVEVSEP
jgi:molecular chaperone GrpE